MDGMRFLLRRTFGRWYLWVFPMAFGAAILLASILEPGEEGNTDYILSRLMGSGTGGCLFAMMMGSSLSADLTGNRCMRSAPIAKRLITRSVPIFFTALLTVNALVTDGIYAAAVLARGGAVSDISDFVILSAYAVLLCVLVAVIAVNLRYGMILLIYAYIPIMLAALIVPRSIKMNGFGLPLGAAAAILAGAAVLALVLGIAISEAFYKKSNFKAYVAGAELSNM